MLRILLATLTTIFLLSPSHAADAPPGQWIVVTAPTFRKTIEPLCDHRKGQGLRVVVVETTSVLTAGELRDRDGTKLRDHLRKLCKDHKGPSYVLLVGAIEAEKAADAERIVVPALSGTAGRMKDQPSDNGFGCLGDSLLPTVAVGRFPARSVDEAKAMVDKTLAYEQDAKPGPWRRRLTVLAGIPAYGAVVDRMVEALAMARFNRLNPIWHGSAIYHNENSRFCVPDDRLQSQALRYVQDGQAFTFYFGHSNALGLWAGRAHYLTRDDWAKLKINRGRGVLATFGCNGCQLRGRDGEGYGVEAIRNPNGPTAVLGSHGICFAAMVQLAADGLVDSAFFNKMPDRLADAWLACKKGLAEGKIDDLTFRVLNAVDGDDRIPLATQRLEHLEMFVLLGDPALRLPSMVSDLGLKIEGKREAGATITVRGTTPARLVGAKVKLTLERAIASVPVDLAPLPKAGDRERNRTMMTNHERANRFTLDEVELTIKDGRFEAKLTLPAKLPTGGLHVRAYAANEKEEAMNVAPLE
jgi:hypothetical protein